MTQSVSPSDGVLVPDEPRGMAEQADGVDGVLVAVAGGELEDGEIHMRLRIED